MLFETDIAIIIPFMGMEEEKKFLFIKEIRENVIPQFKKLGMTEIAIQPVDEEFRDVDKNKTIEYTGKVTKGVAVRDGITRVKREHKPRFILHIDGSGKIPSKHLIDMIRALTETDCGACLANRIDSTGISDERLMVEKFELYILEELFNCKLPDGQCGCWGLDCGKCSNITLSAKGYELELDLLGELLIKNVDFTFVPVKIIDSGKSMFKVKDHEEKLSSLINKFKLKRWQLNGILKSFVKKNGEGCLSNEYIDMVKKITIPEVATKKPILWREVS